MNYVIDIINIIFTGGMIYSIGRRMTILFSVIIAAGVTVLAFIFGFFN